MCWTSLLKNHFVVLVILANASANMVAATRESLLGRMETNEKHNMLPNEAVGFDLLLLVRTWSPTFCLDLVDEGQVCSRQPVQAFTLHGLWPEFSGGGWPEYCPHTKNSTKPAGDARMRCEWPSFHGSDEDFWKHEILKHGSCAQILLQKLHLSNYFDTALDLNDKYDLNEPLQKFIEGNDRKTDVVDSAAFIKALETASENLNRSGIILSCNHKKELSELWVCLDLGLNPRECPPHVGPRSRCGDQFHLPLGNHIAANCSKYFPPLGSKAAINGYNNIFIASILFAVFLFVAILRSHRRPSYQAL